MRMRERGVRRRAVGVFLVAVALLVAGFEIGVRTVTPDAVEYVTQTGGPSLGATVLTRTGTVTDPAQIAYLRSSLTAQPTTTRVWDIALARVQGTNTCSVGTWSSGTYRFTWHGLPVEVVSPAPICGSHYLISSGGWTAPMTYNVEYPLPLAPTIAPPGP